MNRTLKKFVAMLLCALMLISSMTFVSAAEEKSVKASMSWNDSFDDTYNEITSPVFSETDLEPGESVIKYLKLENTGNRAFSYALNFTSAGEIGELAGVIDVYAKNATADVEFTEADKIGTLAEVINGDAVSSGEILPESFSTGNTIVAVALKMQEDASDEYQGKSVGAFDITLTATEDTNFGDYPDKFAVKFENTDKYLYRVGNANAVALGSLFTELPDVTVENVNVTVEKLDNATDVSGTYTSNTTDWTQGTIKFTGTGPVKVTINDDGKNTKPVSLNLEVVSATNVTTYSELKNKNSVLLNDITMSSGGEFYLSNASLYGNGFEFDVRDGAYDGTGYVTGNYLVALSNANLDNIKIIGAVYTQYGGTSSSEFNRSTVLTTGNCVISNSYISNCATPVRANGGHLEIINTTLKGGNFANLDIRNGNIVLDNITTINQVNSNDLAEDGSVVVGLGVVVYYEQVLNTTTIEVKNGITQYNCISESQGEQYITDSQASTLVSEMFRTSYSQIQYDNGMDTWVNSGILSMTSEVGDDNISDVNGYTEALPSMLGTTGYVHTSVPDAESITKIALEYETQGQHYTKPIAKFNNDAVEGNYIAKREGSNDYCYAESDNVIKISFDEGDSFEWSTAILTVTKDGYTVADAQKGYDSIKIDGEAAGESITFSQSGTHTLTYTYTDPYNFKLDENGNVVSYGVTYTKDLTITVSAVKPEAKNAVFAFGDNASKTVTIGNDTYIMPAVDTTSDRVGSKSIDGTIIYYPIIDAYTSDGATEHTSLNSWYMCFPVFKGVISITDYADGGTGAAVTYDSSTTSLPTGLSVENPGSTFLYQSAGSAPTEPKVHNKVLCYTSPTLSNNARSAMTVIAKYTYVDNAGATYYYFVGYKCPEVTVKDTCLTSGALITLADGSQKPIEELVIGDELLAWDFFDGEYVPAPLSIIIDHGKAESVITTLKFNDGTELKISGEHGLYDADLNKSVVINSDNVDDYIGHNFAKTTGKAILVDYEVKTENINSYSLATAKYYNCIADGFFTVTPDPVAGWYDLFEIDDNMKYIEKSVEENIAEYGLYTYDDFSEYLTYEEFVAFNCPYLKIPVGKGYFTFEDILGQIDVWGLGYTENKNPDVILPEYVKPDEADDFVLQNVSYKSSGISLMSTEVSEPKSCVVISLNNNITAGVYSANITCDTATKVDNVYTCTSNTAVFTITANGTLSKGYVIITVDADMYTVPVTESYTLTVKNAYGKPVVFNTSWGTAESNVTDNTIDLGKIIIKSLIKDDNGAVVTVLNSTKNDITGDVYFAVYSKDNILLDVKYLGGVEFKSKDEEELSFTAEIDYNCKIKAFIWKNSDVIPLAVTFSN